METLVHSCDTLWTVDGSSISVELDTGVKRRGTASNKVTLGGVADESVYVTFTVDDWSSYHCLVFWVRGSESARAVDESVYLEVGFGEGDFAQTSLIELPYANIWYQVVVDLSLLTASEINEIDRVRIKALTTSTATVHIDDFRIIYYELFQDIERVLKAELSDLGLPTDQIKVGLPSEEMSDDITYPLITLNLLDLSEDIRRKVGWDTAVFRKSDTVAVVHDVSDPVTLLYQIDLFSTKNSDDRVYAQKLLDCFGFRGYLDVYGRELGTTLMDFRKNDTGGDEKKLRTILTLSVDAFLVPYDVSEATLVGEFVLDISTWG